jgi:hypothetical protein
VRRNVETLRQDGRTVTEPIVATAYEVDSGEMRESLVLPEPSQLAQQLEEIYQDHRAWVPPCMATRSYLPQDDKARFVQV